MHTPPHLSMYIGLHVFATNIFLLCCQILNLHTDSHVNVCVCLYTCVCVCVQLTYYYYLFFLFVSALCFFFCFIFNFFAKFIKFFAAQLHLLSLSLALSHSCCLLFHSTFAVSRHIPKIYIYLAKLNLLAEYVDFFLFFFILFVLFLLVDKIVMNCWYTDIHTYLEICVYVLLGLVSSGAASN